MAGQSSVSNTGSSAPKSQPNLPSVITVNPTHGDDSDNEEGEQSLGMAQTPKHANKTKNDSIDAENQAITPDRGVAGNREQANRRPLSGVSGESRDGPPVGARPSYDNCYPPPRPYDNRQSVSGSAFQPHDSRRPQSMPGPQHPDQHYMQSGLHQLSPVNRDSDYQRIAYYNGARGGRPETLIVHHPGHPSIFEHRGLSEYVPMSQRNFDGAGPQGGRYNSGPYIPLPGSIGMYPPDIRASVPSWGTRPPAYHITHHHHPAYQMITHRDPYHRPISSNDSRFSNENGPSDGTFSRTISSSFDRSVKSRASDGTKSLHKSGISPKPKPRVRSDSDALDDNDNEHNQDASMASEDSSWRQLKQVHSVDENALRERLEKHEKDQKSGRNIKVKKQPSSNSSSLTNSPSDDPERRRARRHAKKNSLVAKPPPPPPPAPQSSSLDSLSSVASAQEPIDTSKAPQPKLTGRSSDVHGAPPSPGNDSASLDLMKCSSGSSGLLHLPNFSLDNKRLRDEEREDVDTSDSNANSLEIRRAPSDLEKNMRGGNLPPNKRPRLMKEDGAETRKDHESKDSHQCETRESPESHEALKPPKPTVTRRPPSSKSGSSPPSEGSYFDKPPSYTYSLDSAPSFPRDSVSQLKQPAYPTLPPRPGSSSSSTITPMGGNHGMQLDHRDHHGQHVGGVVSSIASWEIHAQDSFGGGSVAGQGLTSSFSFQDYPMLAANDNTLGYNAVADVAHPPGMHGLAVPTSHHSFHHLSSHPPIDSRNPSFDSGNFHSGFHRSDSMDISYSGRGFPDRHQGQFPPHAPSWGTAGSGSAGSSSHPSSHLSSYSGMQQQYGGRGPAFNHPGVMRNYSEESNQRTSPPMVFTSLSPARGGSRMPNAFQPPQPQDFSVVPLQMGGRLPPPPPSAVYIMSGGQQNEHPLRLPGKVKMNTDDWSKEDDDRLSEILKKHKNPRDWGPIAAEFGRGRSEKDCHDRWVRYLKPGVRKGQWTDHEDSIVMEAVTSSSEQPFTRWSDLAQRLPGRVGKQIRDRWVNHLNPNINHLPFSREDDLLLWKGHQQLGKRWVEISTKFFNSTRSENHIKNRWYSASFKKFIANEFGLNAYASGKSSSSTTTKKEDSTNKKKKRSPKKQQARRNDDDEDDDDDDDEYRPSS